jgi:transposase-like protein
MRKYSRFISAIVKNSVFFKIYSESFALLNLKGAGPMTIEMTCPTCGSHDISKNGTTRRGKQNYKCRDCNRQFVEDPQWKPKNKDTRALVNLLLLEKIPLAGIARATGVLDSWLQGYANAGYEAVPKAAEVVAKAKGKLNVQMDELWSFVDNKGNKQWVWLAIDADTREIIGCQGCLRNIQLSQTLEHESNHSQVDEGFGSLR